jgi:hypothetical protein
MYLMYVDESGDKGLINSPTRYFVLTGLVVHELRWKAALDRLVSFRKRMRNAFGLGFREELHTAALFHRPGSLVRIKRNDRLTIVRTFADELAGMPEISLINVVIDKEGKSGDFDAFSTAWKYLIQRYSNTMTGGNFPGPHNPQDMGMIFPDHTDDRTVVRLLRKMRRYNPVPNRLGQGFRNLLIENVVEDPNFKDSAHSFFIQAADLAAFLLYQRQAPCSYLRKKGAQNYFTRLDPILCHSASPNDPFGIVHG